MVSSLKPRQTAGAPDAELLVAVWRHAQRVIGAGRCGALELPADMSGYGEMVGVSTRSPTQK